MRQGPYIIQTHLAHKGLLKPWVLVQGDMPDSFQQQLVRHR